MGWGQWGGPRWYFPTDVETHPRVLIGREEEGRLVEKRAPLGNRSVAIVGAHILDASTPDFKYRERGFKGRWCSQ